MIFKKINVLIDDFNHTIAAYIIELERYTIAQLCAKPSPTRWSLGQMYLHLIADTRFYLDQIRICISNNDHAEEHANPHAKSMFANNEFPDEFIEGAPANAHMPQPQSKEHLLNELLALKTEMSAIALLISTSPFTGKTKHPGLHYFSATEWLQFADMHFRHHLRQKKRIDDFLKASGLL
ncbi:MAG: DinB family protein [Cyclobacteriaceae bacterium]